MTFRAWLQVSAAATALVLLPVSLTAQASPETAPNAEERAMIEALQKAMRPGPAHANLAKQAGSWKMTTKFWSEPGGEPMLTHGNAERTMALGGRVLEEKVTSMIGGLPFEGFGRTGYDNVSGEYWSTWTDNMSTGLLVMHGGYDDTGVGIFVGETQDPMTGKAKKVRMVIRQDDEGREIEEFHELSPDGLMVKTMEIVYERK